MPLMNVFKKNSTFPWTFSRSSTVPDDLQMFSRCAFRLGDTRSSLGNLPLPIPTHSQFGAKTKFVYVISEDGTNIVK